MCKEIVKKEPEFKIVWPKGLKFDLTNTSPPDVNDVIPKPLTVLTWMWNDTVPNYLCGWLDKDTVQNYHIDITHGNQLAFQNSDKIFIVGIYVAKGEYILSDMKTIIKIDPHYAGWDIYISEIEDEAIRFYLEIIERAKS